MNTDASMNVTEAPVAEQNATRREASWERAGRASDVADEGPFALSAGGHDLVAIRTHGVLRVFEGRCPHQGALLGEGELEENTLICRNHRWQFERATGQRIGGRQCLRECPSRVDGNDLLVDVGVLQETDANVAKRTLDDLPEPPAIPILGSALRIDPPRLHLVFEDWAKKYGPIYRVRLPRQDLVVVADGELFGPLLRDRPDTYRRISNVEPIFDELSVSGVFSSEGEEWRAQRRLAMEALSHKHLRGFYPTLAKVAERMRLRWAQAAEEGRVVDVAEDLKRFTVDVTTLLVFGRDLNTIEKEDDDVIQKHLAHFFPAFSRRLNAVIPLWRFFKLSADRKLDRALVALREWLGERIAETRTALASDPERAQRPSNFLEAMIVARDAQGRPFSDEVIIGNGLTMLLGGEDTTAYTLAWAVHHLCDSPSAIATLRAEVDAVLGERRVPVDLDEAGRFSYATAVANEAMRLRPVAPILFQEPLKDVVIGDVAIPKGTGLAMLTYLTQRDEKNFVDAKAFRPDRWITPPAGAHDASASLPFGSGPRICPGRTLALVEMRVVLAMLYRNFDVERVGRSRDVSENLAFTLAPVGLNVRLRRRH